MLSLRLFRLLVCSLLCVLSSLPAALGQVANAADRWEHFGQPLRLNANDHIAIIGNTLADRMQHFGHLETMLHCRFPEHDLVIRNLGFSGDTLTVRLRSDNFGSADDWLRRVQADVVFAFFGYNESFAGEAGLPQFRQDLEAFVSHTLQQSWSDRSTSDHSTPRLVLVSPTACEDLKSPHLPDGKENNRRLRQYTAVMEEVAKAKDVYFVDLFNATEQLFRRLDREELPAMTINGVHLSDFGYHSLAQIFDTALLQTSAPQPPLALQDTVRAAVLDKNLHWHNVYRATDGYSVFGGRSALKFVDGQTNFDVMQRELEILEVMVANRDQVIRAAVRGLTRHPDDSNVPEPLQVKTNKPGRMDEGRHRFLSGEAAIREMRVHGGMEIGLFAAEDQFPDLVNPVQCSVGPDGHLWVAVWPTYPHWNPLEPMNDKLLILPDDNGDGRADRCIVFADGLHNPTGFEFWNGGVLLAMAPDILFLKDTDGDGVADIRERIFHGLDSADTHHTANSVVMGPSGRFYFSRGIFHVENFETPWGPTVRFGSSPCGVFEFDPLRFDIRFQFPIGPNPHGDVFDQWGNQFVTDGTGGTGNYVGFPGRGAPGQLYERRVRPVPAITILDSPHFPQANQGNLLIANVIGFQGVTQYKFEEQGAAIRATEVEPIVYSTDPNFRPSDLKIGGDGALYILDWQNPLIGHMQHNLRDPSRDHQHGRVYRVTASGRDSLPVARLKGQPTAEVVQHLGSAMLSERYRARLELTGRDSTEVVAAVQDWAASLKPGLPQHALPLTEALWVHQQHRIPDQQLLDRVLTSAEPRARAAAVRVLTEWSTPVRSPAVADGSPPLSPAETTERLIQLAADDSPLVRAQAIVGAVMIAAPNAAEVVFEAMRHPRDPQIDFNLQEASRDLNLNDYLRRQLATGSGLTSAATAYALSHAGVDDLLKLERTADVYRAILSREHVPTPILQQSLTALAALNQSPEIDELFALIEGLNQNAGVNVLNSLSRLLSEQPAEQLRRVRDRIAALAQSAASEEARRVAVASWMNADGNSESVFEAMDQGDLKLTDVLQAVSLVTSTAAQQDLLLRLPALIPELPGHSGDTPLTRPGLHVDFFAPNPPNVAVETLQALTPAASGTAEIITLELPILQTRDAFALRFTGHLVIDQPGEYTFYIASDDGSRLYLNDELLINNDGLHGMVERRGRTTLTAGLHRLVVTYFDNGGADGLEASWAGPGFSRCPIPSSALVTAADRTQQDLAIDALMQLPGREAEKSSLLAKLLRDGKSVNTSLQALNRIESAEWPDDKLPLLGDAVLTFLSGRPPRERNSLQAQLALILSSRLLKRLDNDEKRRFETQLAELVVPRIEIGTVRERMIYDREVIAVQAGRPVEFLLTNTDNMPHNFAVVRPGFLTEVGELGEATGRDPDAVTRHFIPDSPHILAASRLIQPEQSDTVFFEVPAEPGIYPYVCTYPGHWRRMYGALYVVDDLQQYERDAGAYMAAAGLSMKDAPLKYLGRDTSWQLDDLKGDVMHLTHRSSSFAVGRQLFRAAGCVGCHRLAEEGTNIGPDLRQLPQEYSRVDVLDHILNPSRKIDNRYRSHVIALTSGKIVTGLIVEESDNELRVVDNPLAPEKPIVIRVADIEERQPSDVSIMPAGALNRLTREEILDLLAFVLAGGDPGSPLFADHHHGD